ncbi:MAG TPA: hypothetical protein VFO96_04620 [Gemmatimonadales bacterium]|jgi:hypothetical protein|nr:hypothetical protein [Gemmatimonadales bacterium]
MAWTCARCGEVLADSFGACWRCGSPAEGLDPGVEPTDAEFAEIGAAEEAAAVRQRNEFNEAVWQYKARAGWFPPAYGRYAQAGAGLHRLAVAYRLYRGRQEMTARPARPDLDRKWTAFAIMLGLTGGFVLSILLMNGWADFLLADGTRFVIVWIGLLVGCVLTGDRAVDAELQAEAEFQVGRGTAS